MAKRGRPSVSKTHKLETAFRYGTTVTPTWAMKAFGFRNEVAVKVAVTKINKKLMSEDKRLKTAVAEYTRPWKGTERTYYVTVKAA